MAVNLKDLRQGIDKALAEITLFLASGNTVRGIGVSDHFAYKGDDGQIYKFDFGNFQLLIYKYKDINSIDGTALLKTYMIKPNLEMIGYNKCDHIPQMDLFVEVQPKSDICKISFMIPPNRSKTIQTGKEEGSRQTKTVALTNSPIMNFPVEYLNQLIHCLIEAAENITTQ